MNKYIKQWCFAVFMLSLSSVALAAPKGICTPDNGVFHSTLDFSGYLITANENKVGTTFNTTVTNGSSYPGRCHCDTGNVGEFPYIYYTSKINQALTYAGVHSNINYYDLNPNLDVGIAIDILGVGYVNAPFEYHANNPSGNTKYNCNRIEPLSISSGAKAIVYFYIKKTFAGKLIIPETKIVTLYGTISRDTPVDYSQPMADVYIRGDITAPQSCEINNLQPVYFDFKENVPGPVVYTTDELIAEIKNNDFDKNKIFEFRKTQFNATDGEASKRVVDFLLNDGGKNG